MLIMTNQDNPYDPVSKINTISAPIEFKVRNIDRSISIVMGKWASVDALMSGYAPISKAEYNISGDSYFDMVESSSGNFIGIGDAIDSYLVSNTNYSGAIVVPTTLPVRPIVVPSSGE